MTLGHYMGVVIGWAALRVEYFWSHEPGLDSHVCVTDNIMAKAQLLAKVQGLLVKE